MRYPKEVVLKDCQEAVIRPLEKADELRLRQFYAAVPEDDRWYMRYDVLDPAVIRKWIDGIGGGTVYSIVALCRDDIVAHASLHMRGYGCTSHVGRLRIMVLPDFRHKRLGTWMLLDLIQLAMEKGLRDLRADFVVGVEDAAIESAYKLDFFKKAVLEGYVKDPRGKRYDMMIMTKRLHKDWGDF
ncbi:MAG: GNAT family N-acetyltransferase [Desulfobacterales bacterium]|nr:MAG: GNAT family N-acetyltransferase [Desulfobacterales bacterium]